MTRTALTADPKALVAFCRTGERPRGDGNGGSTPDLFPALLSSYRDLTKLRYDFPLVLVDDESADFVRSLTSIVNELLREAAPAGNAGERIRRNVLALEGEFRKLVNASARGTLAELWRRAVDGLLANIDGTDQKQATRASLEAARAALTADGEVVDCDRDAAPKLLTHMVRGVERRRMEKVWRELEALRLKLAAILEADENKSAAAKSPRSLESSLGTSFAGEFDLEVLSKLLVSSRSEPRMLDKRRQRIQMALAALSSQRFFADPAAGVSPPRRHPFVFDSAADALAAYRERLPEMAQLIGAIRIAQLEIDNAYDEATHDPVFERFDEHALRPDQIALFPHYLVRLPEERFTDAEKARVVEILASDLPIKILVQTDDVQNGTTAGNGQSPWDGWHGQLASMAIGLTTAFVLQSVSANVYQVSPRIVQGLTVPGPALFSVFSGSSGPYDRLAPYLVAATAMQARVFPAFTYNPAAGPHLASRFSIQGNPQTDAPWPVIPFSYEGDDLQRISEELAFSFIDFAATDRRHADDFMVVPRDAWTDDMVPATEFLGHNGSPDTKGKVPYVLMVDPDDRLHRAVVTDDLIRAARRIAETWRSIQELGGTHSSHALRLLEQERARWEEEKQKEIDALKKALQVDRPVPAGDAPAAEAAPAAEPTAEPEVAPEPEVPPGEPWIETKRCNSCQECININKRMFAYDDNKQAYLADLSAGTYRQLVEAAEKCQVAIIHPGKPKNTDEPGLEELEKRAAAFA